VQMRFVRSDFGLEMKSIDLKEFEVEPEFEQANAIKQLGIFFDTVTFESVMRTFSEIMEEHQEFKNNTEVFLMLLSLIEKK